MGCSGHQGANVGGASPARVPGQLCAPADSAESVSEGGVVPAVEVRGMCAAAWSPCVRVCRVLMCWCRMSDMRTKNASSPSIRGEWSSRTNCGKRGAEREVIEMVLCGGGGCYCTYGNILEGGVHQSPLGGRNSSSRLAFKEAFQH